MWRSQGLGVGQTWQNVTAARSFGTVYANTTGKPIFVSIAIFGTAGGCGKIFVSGVYVGESGVSNPLQSRNQLSAIVPHGATYQVVNCSASTIESWAELR